MISSSSAYPNHIATPNPRDLSTIDKGPQVNKYHRDQADERTPDHGLNILGLGFRVHVWGSYGVGFWGVGSFRD